MGDVYLYGFLDGILHFAWDGLDIGCSDRLSDGL
jgi:hypothetical protein